VTTPSAALLRFFVIAMLYALAGWADRAGLTDAQVTPLVALSTGVAWAMLVRRGLSWLPGLLAAGGWLMWRSQWPWEAAMLGAFGPMVGPLVSALLLRHQEFHAALDRRRDLIWFALGGAALTALINVALCFVAQGGTPFGASLEAAWRGNSARWLSEASGVLLVGVPLLTLRSRSLLSKRHDRQAVITLALWLFTVVAGLWSLTGMVTASLSAWVFVPPLLLAGLAVRGGLLSSASAALVLALMANASVAAAQGDVLQSLLAPIRWWWSAYVLLLASIPLLIQALACEQWANDRRWQLALESAGVGTAEWDLKRRRMQFSPRWLAMLGYSAHNFGASGDSVWDRTHPDDRRVVRQALSVLKKLSADESRAEFRMQCVDGSWIWIEGHAAVSELDLQGQPSRILVTGRNITEERRARERQELSAKLFQHLHEGLLITDESFCVLDVNPAFCRLSGYAREELLGTVPALMRAGGAFTTQAEQQLAMHSALKTMGSWRGDMVARRRNGEELTLQVTVSVVKGHQGQVRFHALSISDITQAKAQQLQLERQAHYDELTGLPNRARLAKMLAQAMVASEREGFLLTVCYLDLDHFKPVNDEHGHGIGDRLLMELADRLRHRLRPWASSGVEPVARLGGDEFVLMLRSASLDEARHVVERVLRHVCQPYSLGLKTGPVSVTASIGATVYPIDHADADTLLRHADHAMYGAKQSGRNGFLFFDTEHNRRAEAHFEALGRVQAAFEAEEFTLYYQPKVDMRTGVVLGLEALLRWRHPQHGVISPAQFLPLIEHTALSARVGDWVLKAGIEQLAQWRAQGMSVTLSVNLSARHLQEPDFAPRLAELLSGRGPEVARGLVLEVLETAALADIEHTRQLMEECKGQGVRFALDDFGTGYSTFTYLKRLPLDMLKIDRSFVHNMLDDPHDMAIVQQVIGLSETFRCSLVAEGVETPEQAQRLLELGCVVGQGNGIAEAMPAERVPAWVRDYRGAIGLTAPAAPATTPSTQSDT
jgi:diguanylate cyclase (GGDEF)-like protein/PAS domain S-box-containing protein